MGAAVGVEISKPADGSDIAESRSLDVARDEIIRLRTSLGHLATQAGFAAVILDASDLVLGLSEEGDFERCIAEIIHIRSALRLSTQHAKRRARPAYVPTSFFDTKDDDEEDFDEDEESDDDEEEEKEEEEKQGGSDERAASSTSNVPSFFAGGTNVTDSSSTNEDDAVPVVASAAAER